MLYSIEKLDVDRVVVNVNDTAILVLLLYYWNKYEFYKELQMLIDSGIQIAVHDEAAIPSKRGM